MMKKLSHKSQNLKEKHLANFWQRSIVNLLFLVIIGSLIINYYKDDLMAGLGFIIALIFTKTIQQLLPLGPLSTNEGKKILSVHLGIGIFLGVGLFFLNQHRFIPPIVGGIIGTVLADSLFVKK